MNSIKSIFISIIACLSIQHTCFGDEIITLFLSPYPVTSENETGQTMSDTLKNPGKIAHHSLHGVLQKNIISGIFATYGGYLTTSDNNGMLSFPRKHENPTINILITQQITPSVMTENTLHHWELEAGVPAKMYTATRQQDTVADLFYWDVQEAPLPEDNRIPLDAIIIFAKPKHIYVPIGITPTKNKPNLILPDIFVKKGI